MLTSRIVKQVEIPGEPGEWLKLRMLPGKKLEEARETQTRRLLSTFRAMGAEGAEALAKFNAREAAEELAADPLAEYDIDTLLRAGIIGWSYEEKLTPQAIEELDGRVRRWAAEQLISMSLPSEAEAKND